MKAKILTYELLIVLFVATIALMGVSAFALDGAEEAELPAVVAGTRSIDQYQFVLMRRGEGTPEYPCSEPGLERYYDLDSAQEWVCNPAFEWASPGGTVLDAVRPWKWRWD